MKKGILIFLLGLGAVVILAGIIFFAVINLRNNLVVQEEDIDTQWAQVEVQYQRRYDLIPNLVSSVRGYMKQERDIFVEIADARTRYANAASGSEEKLEAANEVESALGRLLVIMENYPELKSDQTVIVLMTELEGTENRVSTERRRFNDGVNEFNKTIRVFPNNVINSLFLHFEEKVRFEAASGAEFAPEVDLTFEEETETTDTTEETTEETTETETTE